MSQITQVISNITDPPDTNDTINFDLRADNLFNVELPQLVIELNVFRTQANTLASEVNLDAAIALDSKNIALQAKTEARNFATQTGAAVTGFPGEYSSKEWATGDFVPGGSSREWASLIGAPVVTGEYSAKEWAVGDAVPEGSAKFWSIVAEAGANFKGEYSPVQTYLLGEQVSYLGGRYIAKKTNLGITPVSGNDWFFVIYPVEVTTTSANQDYPLVFSDSLVSGSAELLIDSSGGRYNPSTNTATINISGNAASAATATTANTATNQSGGTVNATTITASGNVQLNANVTLGDSGTDLTTINSQVVLLGTQGSVGQAVFSRGINLSPQWETVYQGEAFSAF